VTIPKIGLGIWKYEGGLEPLRQGIELGASSLIDTAEVYSTENAVGETISDIREGVFLATKVSEDHLYYDGVLQAAEASLRQLKIILIFTRFISRTRMP